MQDTVFSPAWYRLFVTICDPGVLLDLAEQEIEMEEVASNEAVLAAANGPLD